MATLPVVLLHAFPLSQQMWRAQHRGLQAAAGVEINLITPDLPGFGDARISMDEPDLGVMAEHVMHLLDQRGLPHVVLGGLSMGGYVVLEILRRRPSLATALILADTKASADTDEARANRERIAATLEQEMTTRVLVHDVFPTLLGERTRTRYPKLVDDVRALVAEADPRGAAWAQRAMARRPDSLHVLRSADVPALVVVGSDDTLATESDAAAMVEALPQGKVEVIRDSGHLSAVEEPEAFNKVVGGFLQTLPPVSEAMIA